MDLFTFRLNQLDTVDYIPELQYIGFIFDPSKI